MADFTITITNGINLFGPEPSNKWGAHDWNAFFWGEGNTDLQTAIDKTFDNTLGLSDTWEISADYRPSIENSMSFVADMESEQLTDAAGYQYVFPSDVTEGEDRTYTNYTSLSVGTTSWSSSSVSTTDWN